MTGADGGPDLVGVTLPGGWRVARHVGEGAMAHVYEAFGPDEQRVAVKVLHGALVHQRDVAFRFRREAELLESIDSPHVLKVLGRGRDERGRFFLVLEFVEGVSLFSLLAQSRTLPYGHALDITMQICRALEAAHAAGIVHRDMKPENVIVDGMPTEPRVKVLDFSISKDQDLSFTATGTILGTPSYMAPEQARGDVTPLSDVYAVGAILYDMMVGRPPFLGTEPGKVLAALLTETPPRPREIAPHVSPAAEAVILRAIARDPNERYADMRAFAGAIEALKEDAERQTAISTLPPPPAAFVAPEVPAPPSAPTPSPPQQAAAVRPVRLALWVGSLFLIALAIVWLATR